MNRLAAARSVGIVVQRTIGLVVQQVLGSGSGYGAVGKFIGINFFAYKRLGLPITRSYDGTNWLSSQRLNTKAGYTAPWMNYVLPEYERDNNQGVILNPDPSGTIIAE